MPDPVTTPEPWPAWLADLSHGDRVRKVVRAVAACYGGDSHDQPATQHCSIGVAEMFLLRLLDEARQQAHYLSTSCFHGEHRYCQSGTGAAEGGETWAKVPASCKFCGAACQCGCHRGEPVPDPSAGPKVTLGILRSRVSAALDAWNEREDGTEAADAVMAVVSPVVGQVWASRESTDGNPAAEVPSEPVIDAVTRVREWAAAEPSGLMLRRDVVGTLDRVLAMSPERAAELADYRGRIAEAVALLHQSSEYAISDALAGHLTRILSDPPRTGSGPSGPT